jgi:hypothetical protein
VSAWHTSGQGQLAFAIARFKRDLPGWWYSVGECERTCDASCAPTRESPHIALIQRPGDPFDDGFHVDLDQPSTLAEALDTVREMALDAIREATR